MSKIRKIGTLTIGQGINVLVNFLFLPYMARVLDYDAYGSYGQVILIQSLFVSLLSFGLPQIIYVYLNKKLEEKEVLSSCLTAALGIGLFGALLLFLFAGQLSELLENPRISSLLRIFSISLLFVLPNQIITSFLVYQHRVKTTVKLSVFANLVKIALVVWAIQGYQSVSLVFWAILASQLLQFGIGMALISKSINLNFRFQLLKEQVKKGFPLGLTGILGAGILYVDGIMVSRFNGVEAYAIYRNGAIEVPLIATLYASIAAIVLPEVSKLFAESRFDEIVRLKRKVMTNTMMITYPILVFLLFNSDLIIRLYLGEKYAASAIIFSIFNLTLLMRVNDYHDILVAANKSRIILYHYVLVFSVNLILNLILIPRLGNIGAAIATVSSLFLFAYLLLRSSVKQVNSPLRDLFEFGKIAQLLGISILLAFILQLATSFIETSYLMLGIFALLYFPAIYLILLKRKLIAPEISHSLKSKFLKVF